GHSLWLVPREPARSTFQSVIDRLSSERTTANFGAHVTLIAGVEPEGGVAEVLSKAESLASELKAISAQVERTACKDLYFQSVFALLARDKALIDAHNAARVAFGQDPVEGSEYMPHVSLLYGDLRMDTREAIRQETEPDLINSELELDSIQVWCTIGVVSEWK
ncbi:unnamed protein product, partial [Laminaria digitata]